MRRILVASVALALVAVPTAQGAVPTVTAAVEPAEPLFGDSFAYVVEAAVAEGTADSVRVLNDIGPFARVAPTRVSRTVVDGIARITVTETIACLTTQCLPGSGGKAVVLPQARVTGAGSAAVAASAQVRVRPRVPDAAVAAAKPVFLRPVALPLATTRVEPRLAVAALVFVGTLLLAVGVFGLAAPFWIRRTGARRVGEADSNARAVRLLRESTTRDSTDRRRAAGLAARIAREPELAVDAAHVAWARAEPRPPDAAALAERMERAVDSTRRQA